ncbi:MAG: hypothetical protein JO068_01320, partial [Hyphomicrobiales bacterium]|nr:hypothetical protein [Hyphomicrobiales bacterium]
IRYTGRLADRLRAVSPELASGFAVADVDVVHIAMEQLRAKLLARST